MVLRILLASTVSQITRMSSLNVTFYVLLVPLTTTFVKYITKQHRKTSVSQWSRMNS